MSGVPELLYATNDNASPDLPGCLYKGDRTDIRQVGGVEYLGEGGEKTPLPEWTARAMLPKNTGVLVCSGEDRKRQGCEHIVGTPRGTWSRFGGGRTEGLEIFFQSWRAAYR